MSTCARLINIPGTPGVNGADGADGAAGSNAFTVTTESFVMPAVGDTVIVTVVDTSWMVESKDVGGAGEVDGHVIVVEFAGSFLVTSIVDAQHVELYNLGYLNNAPPTTVIPSGAAVAPGGIQGGSGASGAGGLLAANNLSDVDNIATSRSNLGLGALALLATISDAEFTGLLSVAKGGTGGGDAATARTNLGLVIGTNVQAFHALLSALAGLAPTAANQLVYSNGVNTLALTSFTAFARTFAGAADALSARQVLDVLPGYGILGSVIGWDLNTLGDTPMTVASSRYIVDKVTVDNASVNLTAAQGGVFGAPGGGAPVIAANQALSALTAATKFKDLTLDAAMATDVVTVATLYARTGVVQAAPATANVRVWGWDLS